MFDDISCRREHFPHRGTKIEKNTDYPPIPAEKGKNAFRSGDGVRCVLITFTKKAWLFKTEYVI